ncbi:Ku protein, partial [Bacillus safensis]
DLMAALQASIDRSKPAKPKKAAPKKRKTPAKKEKNA